MRPTVPRVLEAAAFPMPAAPECLRGCDAHHPALRDDRIARRGAGGMRPFGGDIDVTAPDVTIRNVKVVNSGDDWGIGLRHARNTSIEDADIAPAGARLLVGIKDVTGDATGTRVLRTDIARTTTGIQIHEGLIEDCYIHDMAYRPGDHLNGVEDLEWVGRALCDQAQHYSQPARPNGCGEPVPRFWSRGQQDGCT